MARPAARQRRTRQRRGVPSRRAAYPTRRRRGVLAAVCDRQGRVDLPVDGVAGAGLGGGRWCATTRRARRATSSASAGRTSTRATPPGGCGSPTARWRTPTASRTPIGRHCGCAAWPGRAQRSSRASSSRRRWTCRPTWCCAAPTWSPRRTSLRAASCSPTTAAAGTGASGSHAASASRVRSASRTSATCASSSGARIAGSTPTRAACGRTSSTCAQGALRVRAVRLHVRPAAALLDLPHAVAGVAHRLRAVQDARLHAAHLPPVGVLDRAGAGPPPLADAPGELRRGYAR